MFVSRSAERFCRRAQVAAALIEARSACRDWTAGPGARTARASRVNAPRGSSGSTVLCWVGTATGDTAGYLVVSVVITEVFGVDCGRGRWSWCHRGVRDEQERLLRRKSCRFVLQPRHRRRGRGAHPQINCWRRPRGASRSSLRRHARVATLLLPMLFRVRQFSRPTAYPPPAPEGYNPPTPTRPPAAAYPRHPFFETNESSHTNSNVQLWAPGRPSASLVLTTAFINKSLLCNLPLLPLVDGVVCEVSEVWFDDL
jgi:hypothetical protein